MIINLYAKSTDKDYQGADFDSLSIDRYQINISKFNYEIASYFPSENPRSRVRIVNIKKHVVNTLKKIN